MSRLQDAQQRLEKALARLEDTAAAPGGDGAAAQELERELAAARQRCEMLDERTSEVSQRLDNAIVRIRTLLER